MKILSFDAWKQLNKDLVEELESKKEECDYCDGFGSHECECGDEHDCKYCEGTGYVNGDPEHILRTTYDKRLQAEVEKIAKWGIADTTKEEIKEIDSLITVTEQSELA